MSANLAELSLFAAFAKGFALSAALIMAIGAQNMFVLRQGLRREHVGAIVLFCGTADALMIAAGVAGLGALLTVVPGLTLALRFWPGTASAPCAAPHTPRRWR